MSYSELDAKADYAQRFDELKALHPEASDEEVAEAIQEEASKHQYE